jgi:outer membrane receptor for ferrienterochelin and colicins
MPVLPAALLAALAIVCAPAPQPARGLIVQVRFEGRPVPQVDVRAGDQRATTGANGEADFDLPPGTHAITVESPSHLPVSLTATIGEGAPTRIAVDLERLPQIEQEVVVTATRSETRLKDQALRVEVIDHEEIEEKALMTPGSVAMLLGETTGLRVQTTAPSLGAANVRIQGLRGRYAQLIADGLPLYGAQGDSFSLLQVPPLDLGQVEVIKGVASALYGASALGGVINLVSRRPREPERELLVNATSQTGTDVTAWLAQPTATPWSWTLLGGYHRQERQDLDDDGWADLAAFDRGVLRPRVFYDNRKGRTLFLTGSVMAEDRSGGTTGGAVAPDGLPFAESLRTRHADAGLMARTVTGGGRVVALRVSAMRQSRDRRFGGTRERGVRATAFGEASLQGTRGAHTWVAGFALQQDRFDLEELPRFDYRFTTGSVFAQDEIALRPSVAVALSARVDGHSEYGTLATPRVSLLARPGAGWTIRVSAGTGAFSPTPFTEETDEAGLSRLLPLRGLRAERAIGLSADVTRALGPVEVTATAFSSSLDHALQQRVVTSDRVELINAAGPTRSWGTELTARYRVEGFVLATTHAWLRSTELDPDTDVRREVPLTPRHAASLNAIWEGERWGRFGVEAYYTGRQALEDNPYRAAGRRYWLVGMLAERRWRFARFFVNAENLFDVRQTKEDPLVLPARLPDGRWTVDAWAPLDGRVVNGGVRVAF